MCIGLNIYQLISSKFLALANFFYWSTCFLKKKRRNVGLRHSCDFECHFSILLCLLMIKLLRCSAIGDFSAVDMAYALTNGVGNFEVTPESLRSVLPLINWDKISAMYLPGRSGAECESRYFCSQYFFFLHVHSMLYPPLFISHYCMLMMWFL